MMRQILLLFYLLASFIPCLAQQVDYRALGTNAFFTNGLIVNSKHWTNQAGLYMYRPQGRSVDITGVNPGPDSFFYRNGSYYVGTNVTKDAITLANLQVPYVISMTDSNEPTTVTADWWAIDSEAYGVYGGANITVQQGGASTLTLSGDTGTPQSIITLNAAPGTDYIKLNDNGTDRFVASGSATNVVQANAVGQNWLLIGQTNGTDTIQVRSDGSTFVGKYVSQEASMGSFTPLAFPYVVTMTDSNEANTIIARWHSLDSYDGYAQYGNVDIEASKLGTALLTLDSDNGPEQRKLDLHAEAGNTAINYRSNNVQMFNVNEGGDITLIKSVAYSWPTGYGAETNYVLTDTNKAGSLSWQPGLLSPTGTNIIRSIATNAVSSTSIGPGTNNVISKFNVVGGTNVGNSSMINRYTNMVEFRGVTPIFDDPSTNQFTNRIYSERTSETNWEALDIVSSAANAFFEIHGVKGTSGGAGTGFWPLKLHDSWILEPASPRGGHGAAGFYPVTDNVGFIGTTSTRVNAIAIGSGNLTFSQAGGATVKPWISFSGSYGIDAGDNHLSFYRDTGVTASFNKHNVTGGLVFDLAGNGLVFGTGMSNQISGLINSGIAGLVQVSPTNNTATSTPGNHGIMGVQGQNSDKGGGDLRLIGGPSTGTGTNGNVRLQTAEKANSTSSSLNSSFKDRVFIIADPIILTTNSATVVANITIPTALRGVGGTVHAHTEIENGVDIATTDETFTFTANRKGSTVVAGISAPITCTSSSGGSAAIANTWNAVANSTSVDLKLTCVTSGILSTNSTVRVTLIPNSSAVPVISHP